MIQSNPTCEKNGQEKSNNERMKKNNDMLRIEIVI